MSFFDSIATTSMMTFFGQCFIHASQSEGLAIKGDFTKNDPTFRDFASYCMCIYIYASY